MYEVEKVDYGHGVVGTLYLDEDAPNPRTEYDGHTAVLVCAHSRYDLGDVQCKSEDEIIHHIAGEDGVTVVCKVCGKEIEGDYGEWFHTDDEIPYGEEGYGKCGGEYIKPSFEGLAALIPLYLYDHSGITMSCGAFSCPWDSGQVGWAYITDKVWNEDSWTITPEEVIVSEVKEYDQYLTGDVYGYVVERHGAYNVELDSDSCWGFYGQDYAMSEMKSVAEHMIGDVVNA